MSDGAAPTFVAHVTWAHGGEARLSSLRADAVVLESTTPSPPGSRIDGTLASGSGEAIRVKIHLCRREASGRFRLEGRPIDLTREVRERLVALIESPQG